MSTEKVNGKVNGNVSGKSTEKLTEKSRETSNATAGPGSGGRIAGVRVFSETSPPAKAKKIGFGHPTERGPTYGSLFYNRTARRTSILSALIGVDGGKQM